MKKASEILELLQKDTEKHEIKFREGNTFGNKANMLAYIDARYVMDRLDEATEGYWTSEYKEIKGNLFCGISILLDGEWVTKWDVGVPSNFEAQKGEASDSFKRAGVMWGVGRDLYSLGRFTAPLGDNGRAPYNWKPEGWDKTNIVPDSKEVAPHSRPTKEFMGHVQNAFTEAEELLNKEQTEWMLEHFNKFKSKQLNKKSAETMLEQMQKIINQAKIEGKR
tara:strand:- start:89 stop:754 length:666 start_codon:yes stop_codon:yes gene_type:complete